MTIQMQYIELIFLGTYALVIGFLCGWFANDIRKKVFLFRQKRKKGIKWGCK